MGVIRQDDGDWLDPSNHGSCRLLVDDDDQSETRMTTSKSQKWMTEFCGKMLQQPWLHPSAKSTQVCSMELLKRFVEIPCEQQRNESLNPFLNSMAISSSLSSSSSSSCCGQTDWPLPKESFSVCFENFLKIFSPAEREYFVGTPYYKIAFGAQGKDREEVQSLWLD